MYEQCGDRDGQIWGYPNWRLRHLQSAILNQRLGSIEALCGTTPVPFYQDKTGMNYAQARYLCLYLQEVGKLGEYFDRLRRNVAVDPTGYASLRQVLGEETMVDFQRQWQQFVMGLEWPPN